MSLDELSQLAYQIREFLVDSISITGGHIGANLGTVELGIALHYEFNSPLDRIIWDTGHQGYTQKILTGRAQLFPTLNTYGGMNRFLSRSESEHDTIEASHAGTSISLALGVSLSKKLKFEDNYVAAVIGDGSLCEGMALEALNHASVEDTNLILILNDNGFAISPGFGAIHNHLGQLSKDSKENLFTSMGYEYIGPINGHSIPDLVKSFKKAKDSLHVPIVHVKTIKGFGYEPCSSHPLRLHFSFPFNKSTGLPLDPYSKPGYQDIASRIILEEMKSNDRIVAITPSTLYATGLQPVFNAFPNRCFDPGMEEQHAMGMAAGFAIEGHIPIIFYQSTFMQRAFDQLFHDICFMNLATLILTVRTGFAGYDNPTHHGIYDFAYMCGLPNLRILYPKDRFELERMVRDNLHYLKGPTLIGMPYGPVDEIDESVLLESPASFNQAQVVREGKDMLLIAVGNKYRTAFNIAQKLTRDGLDCGLVNLRYLKPLPEEQLISLITKTQHVVSIEEGVLDGGIGGAIAALILDHDIGCKLLRIGVPTKFVEPGSHEELSRVYGLDENGILSKIKARWFRNE
jgi:1-deoxy-D-xylulose-5-phosphate synthase